MTISTHLTKYSNIYDILYQKGYHSKVDFTHSESLILKINNQIPKNNIILDIGCSNGACVKKLQELGYTAYGIDVSPTAINLATNRGAENCVLGSITEIPFDDNYFDVLTSSDVLEHIFTEDIDMAVKEMYRVVKDKVFLKISTAKEKNTGWVRIYNNTVKEPIENLHTTVLSQTKWESLFKSNHFKIIETEQINANCFEIILQK